ncbi:MAG TPA: magnesium transporter [Cryomorphaceae bacterium]|nr:magnesium transporter [Owenweeksia sp.]MBF99716.1 magnesium transporter [Owenweeksia sp.]HAD97185.1 magnesium transporter [Cryomorphaceae bacterium]HBF19220.1 magnesium transporter [Cryomorphaceae bacterium]HCQ15441.1 magnesium transporter [Cryomorphaceae bacterium]|tara:strand:+ start:89 stop:589 length:501 start_codon:yes stop_codon:yes gene_type:complete
MISESSTQLSLLLDVAIALGLGGLLGLEREWKQKPAGLRTNMIIAGASALFIGLGRVGVTDYIHLASEKSFGIDPTRILHAVIVGVGFLGAGTILKSTENTRVHYLTTSATIWMSSALGIAVALHQYVLAVSVTVLLITINFVFSYVNRLISRASGYPPKRKDEEG